MNYVNLHNHSQYSVLDGYSSIKDMIGVAKKLNMNAISLTDHGTTSGLIKFYKECKKQEIKPILGIEFYISEDRLNKEHADPKSKNYHLVCLAKNEIGYKNILKLSSLANIEGYYYKPRIDLEILRKYSEGVICLSGCCRNLLTARTGDERDSIVKQFQDIFGEEFYIELMPFPSQNQIDHNLLMLHIANKYNIKTVITCDSHYAEVKDAVFHDAMLAIRDKKTIKDEKRHRYDGAYYYIRDYNDIVKSFKENHPMIPEEVVIESLSNTIGIADKCNVEIELTSERIPKFPIDYFEQSDNFEKWKIKNEHKFEEMSAKSEHDKYLLYLIYKNWKERLKRVDKEEISVYKERLKYELKNIFELDFSSYFIIVQDIVNYAKNNNIMAGIGRGSAGGCLVSFLIKITDIDPIEYGLSFERFLCPGRISAPDIDMDFEESGREKIFKYLVDKYGKDHCCKVSTIGYLKARGAIRDAGRVLGYEQKDIDAILKQIPFFKYKQMSDTLDEDIKFIIEDPDNKKLIYQHKKLFNIAFKMYDIIRNVGMHAAAFIILDKELTECMAVRRVDGEDLYVSQYDMEDLKNIGVMKFDILAIRNLDTIKKVIRQLNIDLADIPMDEKGAYELINKGDVTGIFMCETPSARKVLKRFKIMNIDDLIAFNAINRTGPLLAKVDEMYEKNRKNISKIHYANDVLRKILSSTYGCLVYQEQLMEISKEMAGFTHAEADNLRKQISAKDMGKFNEMKEKFISGSVKNGHRKEDAIKIWQDMEGFARYAFNKSHSAAYAVTAYYTAYLKYKYPLEFLLALINTDKKENIKNIIRDFNSRNIEVLKPDINLSKEEFTIHDNKVISGFNCINGVGEAVIQEIIKHQPYSSLDDFLTRVDLGVVNRTLLYSFLKCGIIKKEMYNLPVKMIIDEENLKGILKYYKKNNSNGGLFQLDMNDLCKNKIQGDFTPKEILEEEKELYIYEGALS